MDALTPLALIRRLSMIFFSAIRPSIVRFSILFCFILLTPTRWVMAKPAPIPPPERVSPPITRHYDCSSYTKEFCCARLSDPADQSVCMAHYDPTLHQKITKIPYSVSDLSDTFPSTEPASGESPLSPSEALCILPGNCTLYIFDAQNPIPSSILPTTTPSASINATGYSNDNLTQTAVYYLPADFSMPYNSAFVGNLQGGRKPEFTVGFATSSEFVIRANNPFSTYLLAHIEVDSRGEHTPDGTLDFTGAGTVRMHNVKIVRNPNIGDNDEHLSTDFHAITLGCPNNTNPKYYFTNSEIDLTNFLKTFVGSFRRPAFSNYSGDAFHIKHCGHPGQGVATLQLKNTRIAFDFRIFPTDSPFPDRGDLRGSAFLFDVE